MEYCYYELKKSPDFSLNKYATLSETGPSGVITQHHAFWRQINQWGKMFGGIIHFIYEFNPKQKKGKRMKLVIRFDSPSIEGKTSIIQIMKASVLAPYYDQLKIVDETCLTDIEYRWQINLLKHERFIESSFNENEKFYTTSEWEMNSDARLYSLLKMMEVIDSHCAYCVTMYPGNYITELENGLTYIMPHLRELNSFKVKTNSNSVSSGGRDENAKKALEFYEDVMDSISNSPHFLVNIQAYAQSEIIAKQLLDAAASEALRTGNHSLYGEQFGHNIYYALNQKFTSWSDPSAEDNLIFLPHLMTLEEVVPYAVLPVLFSGESIEMPKETIPEPKEGMFIGRDELNHDIFYPWKQLSKHAFLAGMPGSGKTNTMMYLVSEIYKSGIPVLVLEPAKKEYRVLTTLKDMDEMALFSPSANSMFPIHINPFEFPKGMKLADHINRLLDVFNGTFQLDPPMPMLLTEGIQACYQELLWLPGMINSGDLEYPTMSMLYEKVDKLLDKYGYAPDIKSNLKSILQVRIGTLLSREMGDIFDVKKSTFAPEEWLKKSAVIELAALGTGPSNFLMLMLMTLIRESLDVQVYTPSEDGKPRHVIFLEEAHNLIANTSVQAPGGLDPKVSATAFITKMLAEVRALGEGIVIADQLPTAMAPEVVKNTSLKFGLRLTSQDERELLGASMSADGVQMEKMGIFTPGHCLVSYEELLRPFEMQIPEFKGDESVDDYNILQAKLGSPTYHENMYASANIMYLKYEERRLKLSAETESILKEIQNIRKKWKDNSEFIKQIDESTSDYQPTEKENSLLKEKRNSDKRYWNLMDKWCTLTLEVMLYMGVTMIRRKRVEVIQDMPDEIRRKTVKAHNQWLDIISSLYKTIQNNRADMKARASKYGITESELVENRLRKQQNIIKSSWTI